jgi:hypothetical protein
MPLRRLFATIALLLALASSALAQTRPAADEPIVSTLTFGPGPLVFERFGHNAIRVQIPSRGLDVAFDWGNFSFEDPDFIKRFVVGDTRYWLARKEDGRGMIDDYAKWADRTVVERRLGLSPAQTLRLLVALDAQDTEANRYYAYDSGPHTAPPRWRAAVAAAAAAQLRSQFAAPTPHGYRWHTRRLLSVGLDNRFLLALIDFCFGPRTDVPLTEWEAAFLPMEFGDRLDRIEIADESGARRPIVAERRVWNTTTTPGNFEPAVASRPAIGTTVVGLLGAGLLVALARFWRLGFILGASAWEAFAAFGGIFFASVILFTKHWVVAWNANFLQFSPIALVVIAALCVPRWRRALRWAAPAALGLSLAGLLLTIAGPQRAAPAVGLALPLHAAVWFGLRTIATRRPAAALPEGSSR